MRKLVDIIDAGEFTCDDCTYLSLVPMYRYYTCQKFGVTLTDNFCDDERIERCVRCLESDVGEA